MRKFCKYLTVVFVAVFVMIFFAGCGGKTAKEEVIDTETFDSITVSVIKRTETDGTETIFGKIVSYNADKDTEVVIYYVPDKTPKGVKITVIGSLSFYEANISCVVIKEGMLTIETFAFGYSKLAIAEIPSTVKSIESYAFVNCINLARIEIAAATPPDLGGYAFRCLNESSKESNKYTIYEKLKIFVPDVQAYVNVKSWAEYSAHIKKA